MKTSPLLLSFALLLSMQLTAQSTYQWATTQGLNCSADDITTTENVYWGGLGCTAVTVLPDNETFNISASEDNYVFGQGENVNAANTLPGSTNEYGYLSIWLEGDLTGIDSVNGIRLEFTTGAGSATQRISAGTAFNPGKCPQLVAGGSPLVFVLAQISTSAPLDNDLRIRYSFTPAFGTLLTDIVVPDTSFNGTFYDYNLPTGTVNVYPLNGVYNVGLETNTPDAQQITISKSEGTLVIAGSGEVEVQKSSATNEVHDVTLQLDSTELCFGFSEFMVGNGATLSLDKVSTTFDVDGACLFSDVNGRILIPEGAAQVYGEEGFGLIMFMPDAVMTVERNASLTLSSSIVFGAQTGLSVIDVREGGELILPAESRASAGLGSQEGVILVRLHGNARFDSSAAPEEVQRMFTIETISSTPTVMERSAYTVAPNPTADGVVMLRAGTSDRPLTNVDVIDLTGRVLNSGMPQQAGTQYQVQLPGSGMYIVRFTDVDGRVGTARVVAD